MKRIRKLLERFLDVMVEEGKKRYPLWQADFYGEEE